MADIHVLEGENLLNKDKLYQYRVVYHIPINNPKPEVTFPDFESVVPTISTDELDAIKAGILVELVRTERYNTEVTDIEQGQKLKDRWIALNEKVNQVYPVKYKYFGTELNVT